MAGRVGPGGGGVAGRVGVGRMGLVGCGEAGRVEGRRAGWVGGWAGMGRLQRTFIHPERVYVTAA